MKLRLSVNAKDLVKAFEAAPAKTKGMVTEQLEIAVETIRDYASDHHRYTTRTGNLERNGISAVVEDNKGLLWIDTQKVPYARLIHEGRATNLAIVPRHKKALRWVGAGNQFMFAKRVVIPAGHPAPDQFLYEAAEHELPVIQSNFEAALQRLLEEL